MRASEYEIRPCYSFTVNSLFGPFLGGAAQANLFSHVGAGCTSLHLSIDLICFLFLPARLKNFGFSWELCVRS